MIVDRGLKFHEHIRGIVGKVSELASSLLRATVNRNPELMVALFVTHIRLLLDYYSCG